MDELLLGLLNRTLAHPNLDDLMVLLSSAGLVVLPGIGLWLLLHPGHRREALILMLSLVATLALTLALQELIGRPRPHGVRLVLPTPAFHSYPSGHAAMAWCAATLLALSYRRSAVIACALLGAMLISFSRVYLGHHHPSDLMGGAVLGAAVGAFCYGLFFGAKPWPRWLLWPQLALVVIISQLAYLGLLPRGWSGGLGGADKLLHFLLFGSLALTLHLWLRRRQVALGRLMLPLAAVIVVVAAALEEGAQLLSSNRSSDPLDLLCDLVGVAVFVGLFEWIAPGSVPGRRSRRQAFLSR